VASLVAELRAVCPGRGLTLGEALRVGELQANRLLAAREVIAPPVPDSIVTEFPRVDLARLSRVTVSGSVHWSKGRWVIVVNRAEPYFRQRFSAAHELKHVLDWPFGDTLYPDWRGLTAAERAEQAADHFAACLLMPKAWVKRAYYDQGVTDLRRLSARFSVSQAAMRVRLTTLGMVEPMARCAGRTAA
jgi:Zn-dependent peptidase ImmA (M78 family)